MCHLIVSALTIETRYLCIMLYVKLMRCSGLPWIYGRLEEGWGSVCHENYSVYWSYMDLWSIGGGVGVHLSWKCFGVMVFQRSMLNWGGWGPSAKVGLSAKSFTFHALPHRRSFHITYKRPNDVTCYILLEVEDFLFINVAFMWWDLSGFACKFAYQYRL